MKIPEVTRDAAQFTKIGPLDRYSDVRKEVCGACGERFKTGDYYTVVPLGPGADADERKRARERRWYAAIGVFVHWACATGKEAA